MSSVKYLTRVFEMKLKLEVTYHETKTSTTKLIQYYSDIIHQNQHNIIHIY